MIGAGLAGLTAARELRRRGHSVLVLEARERIGGRLHSTPFAGRTVDLGGQFVHWFQPHVFSEISRLGLGYEPAPEVDSWSWWSEGKLRHESQAAVVERLEDLFARALHDAAETYPMPMSPTAGGALHATNDLRSMHDRIEEVGFSREERDLFTSIIASAYSASSAQLALTVPLHDYALAGHSLALLTDMLATYSLKPATDLVGAIADEVDGDMQLGTPVAAVEHSKAGVVVSTRGGESFTSGVAVLAVPLNTVDAIHIDPPLPGEGAVTHAGKGIKTWIQIRGLSDPSYVSAPEDDVITFAEATVELSDGLVLCAFGPDAGRLDPSDRDAVAAAIHRLLPGDYEVVAVTGHDWLADEFSRGTWCAPRPGQLTTAIPALREHTGRLMLAGGDLATGWIGTMDGAIESGQLVGRALATLLDSDIA